MTVFLFSLTLLQRLALYLIVLNQAAIPFQSCISASPSDIIWPWLWRRNTLLSVLLQLLQEETPLLYLQSPPIKNKFLTSVAHEQDCLLLFSLLSAAVRGHLSTPLLHLPNLGTKERNLNRQENCHTLSNFTVVNVYSCWATLVEWTSLRFPWWRSRDSAPVFPATSHLQDWDLLMLCRTYKAATKKLTQVCFTLLPELAHSQQFTIGTGQESEFLKPFTDLISKVAGSRWRKGTK